MSEHDTPPERPTGWEGAERWFAAPDADGSSDGPDTCETCGARLDADQTYCLECGTPTSRAPRLMRSLRAPALIAGGLALLGIGAGALAFAVADGDSDRPAAATTLGTTATTPAATLPETGPLPPDPTATEPLPPDPGGGAEPPPDGGLPTVTEQPPIDPGDDDLGDEDLGNASDWPVGRTAWTAILSSVRRQADAEAARARLERRGQDAGVLFSSDFPSMRPGYYVLFSGVYTSRGAAISQARRLRDRFPDAYARRVSG